MQSIWPNNPGILQSHDGENASFANCHSLICPKIHLLLLGPKRSNILTPKESPETSQNTQTGWALEYFIRPILVSEQNQRLSVSTNFSRTIEKEKKWVNFLGTNESVAFGKKWLGQKVGECEGRAVQKLAAHQKWGRHQVDGEQPYAAFSYTATPTSKPTSNPTLAAHIFLPSL